MIVLIFKIKEILKSFHHGRDFFFGLLIVLTVIFLIGLIALICKALIKIIL